MIAEQSNVLLDFRAQDSHSGSFPNFRRLPCGYLPLLWISSKVLCYALCQEAKVRALPPEPWVFITVT